MAQWRKDNQAYDNQSTRHEVMMISDQYGNIVNVSGSGAQVASLTSAFGEPIAIPITPIMQLDALYGIPDKDFEKFTASTGSVTSNTTFNVQSGTGAYGYAVVRSRRAIRYRPGQGALARFTAMFDTPTANYTQRAGCFLQEQSLMIGYDGTQLGVLRQNGGKAHIHRFTPSASASGSETVTITLNGTAFNVAVTSGTIQENLTELGNATYTGWVVEYSDTDIVFLSTSVGPKAGSFSISSTGTFASSNDIAQAGVNDTNNWTYQADWNMDKLDGTGTSGITLDPSKLNVFQIDFRWLGAGVIRYAIENPNNGDMLYFHSEYYSNRYETPHLDNPSFKVGYVVADTGGSGGTNLKVAGASMMGAIEGVTPPTRSSTASTGRSFSGAALSGSNYHHIITIKNRLVYNDKINTKEVILKQISLGGGSASGTPVQAYLYFNPTYATDIDFTKLSNTNSTIFYGTTTTTITHANFVPLTGLVIGADVFQTVDLDHLNIVIPPNNTLGISFFSTSNINDGSVVLTWVED